MSPGQKSIGRNSSAQTHPAGPGILASRQQLTMHSGAYMSKVMKIHRNGVGLRELEKCSVVPVEAILSGFADEMGDVHFESADGSIIVGTWQSTPYAEMLSYPNGMEYSVILLGKVSITSPDGTVETFEAGESYLLPQGVEVRFEVLETMRKLYVLYTSKTDG
jgi:uncharacterized cupin superfamily protein